MEFNKNIFNKKPKIEHSEGGFQEKLDTPTQDSFGDNAAQKTQEERQADWDKKKAEQSAKFDPKNLEQTDLFSDKNIK